MPILEASIIRPFIQDRRLICDFYNYFYKYVSGFGVVPVYMDLISKEGWDIFIELVSFLLSYFFVLIVP